MKKKLFFKLDKRHNGHNQFKYGINFLIKNKDDFIQKRNWCWQTWGPSAELDLLNTDSKWAWISNQYHLRLYLLDEKELNWFLLKWSSND